MQKGRGAFDGLAVIGILERPSDVKLELARFDVGLVLGHSEDRGSLRVGSEGAPDSPTPLEECQGDMRGELKRPSFLNSKTVLGNVGNSRSP